MRARSVCALAALAAGVGLVVAHVRRELRLHLLLRGERAARRLTESCLYRDMQAFRGRLEGMTQRAGGGASSAGAVRSGGDGAGGDVTEGGVRAGTRFGFGSDLGGGR